MMRANPPSTMSRHIKVYHAALYRAIEHRSSGEAEGVVISGLSCSTLLGVNENTITLPIISLPSATC